MHLYHFWRVNFIHCSNPDLISIKVYMFALLDSNLKFNLIFSHHNCPHPMSALDLPFHLLFLL